MLPLPSIIAFALLLIAGCNGFTATRSNQLTRSAPTRPSAALTRVGVLPDSLASPGDARGYFALWFFGGSGGGGIALKQFPRQFENFQKTIALSGEGPTVGGETVGVSPLCLYPRDLSKGDLDKVFNNKLSVEQMVERGPKPNYLSECGYLCFDSFVEANKGCNPLTVRAVFDAMSTSDIVSPEVVQAKLDEFSGDTSPDRAAFKSALLQTKLAGFSSIAFLLFLLGPIVGSTCLDAGAAGWFPDWPGNDNMPWSLLAGPGVWTIPEYWI